MGPELIGNSINPSTGGGWWWWVAWTLPGMFSLTDNLLFIITCVYWLLSPVRQNKKNKRKKVRGVDGRGGKYMTWMKRNQKDKRGNGFWWLAVIMCTDFGGIRSVDVWPYGCLIFYLIGLHYPPQFHFQKSKKKKIKW